MRTRTACRWVVLAIFCPFLHAEEPVTQSLDELLAEIPSLVRTAPGIGETQQLFAEKITAHGTKAVDPLITLLDDADKNLSYLVGYCLLELDGTAFQPRHLEPLAKAARRHRGWLPGVIADIGTDEAAVFLAAEMRRKPETMAQIDHALVRLAPKSIGPLLREFEQAGESETEFTDAIAYIFRECGTTASSAIDPLEQIASNANAPLFRRQQAIRFLGEIGPPAQRSFPGLRKLAEKDPETFSSAVRNAIAASRTADAADVLIGSAVTEARDKQSLLLFRDLATEAGKEARRLAGTLVDLLDDPDPNIRLGACRSLGFLGNPDVWPQLCRKLKETDWRIAFAATFSLAQLQANGAIPSLERCKASHWYPRVRDAADFALRRIRGEKETEEDQLRLGIRMNEPNLESVFLSFEQTDYSRRPLGESKLDRIVFRDHPFTPLYFDPPKDLPEEILSMSLAKTHPGLHRAIAPLADIDWKFHSGFGATVHGILQNGKTTFVGINAGEWVAGLYAVESDGKAREVFRGNIAALLDWNGRVIIMSGTYHMGMDHGAVFSVQRGEDGWQTKFLHALPGCPWSGGILTDGRLFANCQGGAVAISPGGTFEYLGSGERDGAP